MKKKIFFLISFFLFLFCLNAEQSTFSIIGVRYEVKKQNEGIVTVFFNSKIDVSTVNCENIFINGKELSKDTKFTFSRIGRSFEFPLFDLQNDFSMIIAEIQSIDGKIIKPIRLSEISNKTFWKFSKETHKWQKF